MFKIVADRRIPYLQELFGPYGELIEIPGTRIGAKDLKNADVLLTRTVTPVNAALLQGSAVEFVGSTTGGHDHIDAAALKTLGMTWAYAPGSNAQAVAEYVLCCIAALRQESDRLCDPVSIAVMGVGHVGSRVAHTLSTFGFEVLLYDPPRAIRECSFESVSLEDTQGADIICVVTPLTWTGSYPTYHMIDAHYLEGMRAKYPILINAGRGAAINNEALLKVIQEGRVKACLDVWEHEPNISSELLKNSIIGTPHVAGYTRLAKWRTVYHVYREFLKHFHLDDHRGWEPTSTALNTKQNLDISDCETWESVLLKVYNPMHDTEGLQHAASSDPHNMASVFQQLRRVYPRRHEFSQILLTSTLTAALKESLAHLNFDFG